MKNVYRTNGDSKLFSCPIKLQGSMKIILTQKIELKNFTSNFTQHLEFFIACMAPPPKDCSQILTNNN